MRSESWRVARFGVVGLFGLIAREASDSSCSCSRYSIEAGRKSIALGDRRLAVLSTVGLRRAERRLGESRREEDTVMKSTLSRRGFVQMSAAGAVGLVAGCGTILHPERRNQPPGGGLDWGIVAMDAVGLLLFFIPGVIAFAVDFSTGAIYLPPDGYGDARRPANDEPLVEVQVPPKELTPQRLEQVASMHAGRDVRLVRGEFLTAPLAKLAEFWPTWEKLAS